LRTLLDTSVVVAMREGDVRVIRRSAELRDSALLSILSVVELEGGVPLAPGGAPLRREKLDEIYGAVEVLPFEWDDAAAYRRIVEECGFSRPKIIDRMIAAQAVVAGASLATLNPRDFRGIPGLVTEDWSK
jgi:predicted nucleic acid-binding protein